LFPNQAQFHPLKYRKGVTEAILRNGGKIFTETHIQDILPEVNQIKTSDGYAAFVKNIVIATNAPIVDKVSKIYDKQQAYRTYVIGARIKKDRIPKALYWDTGNQNSENAFAPYHYVRIQHNRDNNDSEYDILIIGGEDHLTGNIMNDRDLQ
jgi:glycine/D-amino acid oxidase-like deaminating enzyme